MRDIVLLIVCLATATALPSYSQRIVGGAVATINQYPSVASLLYSWDLSNYFQSCGGSILTTKSILTAGHCGYRDSPTRWRVRVGSSYANSRGITHSVASIITHANFSYTTLDYDIAILRLSSNISFVANTVKAATIAGLNYVLNDNQVVWAVGWGTTSVGGSASEQLRHVQIWTVNQNICGQRYALLKRNVTANMLCSGWIDVGGRDACQEDSGGPLYHNGVVVGITSWGQQCALAYYPGVSTRVSRFTPWIQANA